MNINRYSGRRPELLNLKYPSVIFAMDQETYFKDLVLTQELPELLDFYKPIIINKTAIWVLHHHKWSAVSNVMSQLRDYYKFLPRYRSGVLLVNELGNYAYIGGKANPFMHDMKILLEKPEAKEFNYVQR